MMNGKKHILYFLLCLCGSVCCMAQSIPQYEAEIQELERQIMSLKNDLNLRNKIIYGLKQDNAYLKKRVNFLELATSKEQEGKAISHFATNYDFKVVSCFGDRLYQTVTLNFLIRNRRGKDQRVIFDCAKPKSVAYDPTGSAYSIKNAIIGNVEKDDNNGDSLIVNLPHNAYVKGAVVFRAVLGGTQFKLVRLDFSSENEDSSNRVQGLEEIKNLNIKWR